MSDDRIIRLDDYRPQPTRPERGQQHTLRSLIHALWPSALFLAALYAGEYFIGGLVQHIVSVAISLAMIAWAIAGIVRPRAQDWLDPVADAHLIAINRRNTRWWSIISLLLWILVSSYTIFNLILSE